MKSINSFFLGLVIVFSLHTQVSGQHLKPRWSVEIDPATFLFEGYGVHIRVAPTESNQLLIGAGTYAMNFPDMLVDLNNQNKNKNWNVRLNQGYGLFGEYYFTETNNRWFVGMQLSTQQYKINQNGSEGSKYTNLLTMGYAGYSLPLGKSRFYVKPWGGLGYSEKLRGSNQVGDQKYNIAALTYFMTLHLGYRL